MRFLNFRVLIGIMILIAIVLAGYYLMNQQSSTSGDPSVPNNPIINTENLKAQIDKNSIFDTQTASIRGKVIDTFDGSIKVENKNKAQGTFTLYSPFYVYKTDPSGKNSAGSKIEDIELNKDVTINFLLISGEYKVTSLSYQ